MVRLACLEMAGPHQKEGAWEKLRWVCCFREWRGGPVYECSVHVGEKFGPEPCNVCKTHTTQRDCSKSTRNTNQGVCGYST